MEFRFYIDQKYTAWDRTHFIVEAESKEQAVEKLKSKIEDYGYLPVYDFDENTNTEGLDTIENLSPSENNGFSTEELYDRETSELIWKNGN